MLIGLCGAQGSGKTTLGAAFAKQNPEFTFAATSVSAIMRECGMDPALDYPIAERVGMQQRILTELDAFYGRFDKNVVFDRTPLDAAAYMLADVQRQNVPPGLQADIVKYVERCIEVTSRRFGMLLLIPPVLKHEGVRDGKAPHDPAYTEHIHLLIQGLAVDTRMKASYVRLSRGTVALEDRLATLRVSVGRVMDAFVERRDAQLMTGMELH